MRGAAAFWSREPPASTTGGPAAQLEPGVSPRGEPAIKTWLLGATPRHVLYAERVLIQAGVYARRLRALGVPVPDAAQRAAQQAARKMRSSGWLVILS